MTDIALVSYLNTRPFMDGFEALVHDKEVRFHLLPPADCAHALETGRCQMALLPSGAIPGLPGIHLLPDYCIGANGKVDSVFIFSQRPLSELDTLLLDPHSRSSNALAQILLRHHWRKDLNLVVPDERPFDLIGGSIGAVAIGDKAIRMRPRFAFAYDLAAAWKEMTGLPFAFAVWAFQPGKVSPAVIEKLTRAMSYGVSHVRESAERWAAHFQLSVPFARKYLSESIDYRFDAPKHRALHLYLQLIADQRPLSCTSILSAGGLQAL
ncbi:MAG: hypothetical protein EAZ89_16910 [Bacteroidetes bacterium]|nr:MAG: hypothetical protein EAZ89_16910 [Bacteroidota bacterium]